MVNQHQSRYSQLTGLERSMAGATGQIDQLRHRLLGKYSGHVLFVPAPKAMSLITPEAIGACTPVAPRQLTALNQGLPDSLLYEAGVRPIGVRYWAHEDNSKIGTLALEVIPQRTVHQERNTAVELLQEYGLPAEEAADDFPYFIELGDITRMPVDLERSALKQFAFQVMQKPLFLYGTRGFMTEPAE